jgi:hypothetical protein
MPPPASVGAEAAPNQREQRRLSSLTTPGSVATLSGEVPFMSGREDVQSLLALRKLTRAITDLVRVQMSEYLKTLTPLMRPKALLGDYVQGGLKEPSRKSDKAFADLQALYDKVATAKPFNLPRELAAPLSFPNTDLEITPLDYFHAAQAGADTRRIRVRSPLTWVLTYREFPPNRLQELLDSKARSVEELQRFVLNALVIHLAATSDPGLARLFEALHFPLTTSRSPQFGELPMTHIGIGITTTRPSDALVIESAELTGMDVFEEVVKVEDITRIDDPFKQRLIDVARQHAPELV